MPLAFATQEPGGLGPVLEAQHLHLSFLRYEKKAFRVVSRIK